MGHVTLNNPEKLFFGERMDVVGEVFTLQTEGGRWRYVHKQVESKCPYRQNLNYWVRVDSLLKWLISCHTYTSIHV